MPPSLRLGRGYRRWRVFLEQSQRWPREELERYQRVQLEKLLRFAYEWVPYYRSLFRRLRLKSEHLQDPGILKEIPLLTRETVLDNLETLIDSRIERRRLRQVTTGGSSERQLKIFTHPRHWTWETAFAHDLWSRVGYHPGSKLAVLRGETVRTSRHPQPWKYDPWRRALLLSSYHLTEENLAVYVEKMREYRIEYLHCYPSTAMILGRFLDRHRECPRPSLKAVLASSENTYPGQREFLEMTFRCRYFDLYGLTEGAALAGECEANNGYHLYPQYGYVEIIDKTGNRPTPKGEEGEIVGTGFINQAMPLIRYRTGDWAVPGEGPCPCGRAYPLLKTIRGKRERETVIGKNGNLVPLVNSHSAIYDRVKQYQFSQEEPGVLLMRIVRAQGYGSEDTAAIRKELENKMGESVALEIAFVEDIPRTVRGKHLFLIQKISPHAGKGSPAKTNGENRKKPH